MIPQPRRRGPLGFTLVELLVVIIIILLVSAVVLPTVVNALSHRQVSEAARILQGALVQARDTAIRFNAPRGVRFLPDPTYANSPTILAYNRMIPIEPGPEYSNGMVTIWPVPVPPSTPPASPFPAWVPYPIGGGGSCYPYYLANTPANASPGQVLMIEQAPFIANDTSKGMLAPTSWYWNIRLGDQIQINNTGRSYTVVGPCTINPLNGGGNPELFVNVGQPGDTTNYLPRQYTNNATPPNPTTVPVEFLYLVNQKDDAGVGYVDSGWDGVVNVGLYGPAGRSPVGQVADNLVEWQNEQWLGALAQWGQNDVGNANFTTILTNGTVYATANNLIPSPLPYTITRRPVPAQSARETMLPSGVVIDATTAQPVKLSNGTAVVTSERSRLPIDPFSRYVDILLLPTGQVVPTTLYSSPASFTLTDSFYHFWLAERQDVHEVGDVWGNTANPSPPPPLLPNPNPNAGNTPSLTFLLPMPQDAYNNYAGTWASPGAPQVALKGERMLVTLFSRTGQITANSVEFFNVTDVNTPFYDSQLGAREAK